MRMLKIARIHLERYTPEEVESGRSAAIVRFLSKAVSTVIALAIYTAIQTADSYSDFNSDFNSDPQQQFLQRFTTTIANPRRFQLDDSAAIRITSDYVGWFFSARAKSEVCPTIVLYIVDGRYRMMQIMYCSLQFADNAI